MNKSGIHYCFTDHKTSSNYMRRVRTGGGGFTDATGAGAEVLPGDVLIKLDDAGPWFAQFRDVPISKDTPNLTPAAGDIPDAGASEGTDNQPDAGSDNQPESTSGSGASSGSESSAPEPTPTTED